MKKIIVFLFLLHMVATTYAQKASLATGIKNDNGKLAVQLKFMFPDKILSSYSVNVFRKQTPGGTWQKVSTAPVTKAPITLSQTDEPYRNYKSFVNHKPAPLAEDENNILAFAGLMVIMDNTFAMYAGCYYEDKTAEAGKSYQYRITDASGGDKELAVSADIRVAQDYLPQVSGFAAKQSEQTVLLNWERNSRFYAYRVYKRNSATGERRSLSASPILLGRLTGSTVKDKSNESKYTDTNVVAGNTVYYEVAGIDVLGNESPASAQVSVVTKDMVAPAMVNKLKFTIDKGDVKLTWQSPRDGDIKGYNVYRNSTSDTVYKKMNTSLLATSILSYTDKELKEGASYGYKVESVDAAGNTTSTRPVRTFLPDRTPPAKPTGLKAICKPGMIQLSWTPNKETDVIGYYIYRANIRNKLYYSMLYREPIKASFFNDTLPAVAKNEFIYYIQAVDKHYRASVPSDTVIAMMPDTTAPSAPFIRSAEYAAGNIKVTWAATDNDGVLFNIYRSDDSIASANYRKINATPLNEKSYTDKVEAGRDHHYYVLALDLAGNASPRSQIRSCNVPFEAQSSTSAGNIKANFSSKDTSVTLSWKNTSKDVRGAIVYRKAQDDEVFISVSDLLTTSSYTDKVAEPGKKYQYRIRSYYSSSDEYTDSEVADVIAQW